MCSAKTTQRRLHLLVWCTIPEVRYVPDKFTHHVCVIQRGATKTNGLESHMDRHPHGAVCLFRQLSCLSEVWFCMNWRQRVVMSNHSVFVEKCLSQSLAGVWKIKTRKLLVRSGWSRHKEVAQADRHMSTHPQAGLHTQQHNCTQPGVRSCQPIGSDQSGSFSKKTAHWWPIVM